MEFYQHPTELSNPPPERELKPELELAAPPPEFGQGSGPQGESSAKKRRLRQLLAIPAALLTGVLFVHGANLVPIQPEPSEPVPVETAEPVPEGVPGSVVLDVLYAVRDAKTVRYSYNVYTPIPSLDATQDQIDAYKGTPYPISVYTRVSDEADHMIAPAEDPDVWESARTDFEYSLDATGMEGELTLTLTAVYTEEGEERQTKAVLPLPALPPAPLCSAQLELLGSGGILYSASFVPQAGDDHDYQLRATSFSFAWFDAEGNDCGEAVIWEWDTMPTLSGSPAEGFAAAYEGPAWIERPNDEATQLCARLILLDETTGYPYRIDSNVVLLSLEPTLNGSLDVFPGGDAYAEFHFDPAPGDEREYDLQVVAMGQTAFQADEIMGFSLVDDPRAVPVTGDRESGYIVTYSGGTAAASIPQDAQLSLYVVLEDRNTGEQYTIETNRVDAVERIVPYDTWPLGDGKIVIMVYNDTDSYTVPGVTETEMGLTLLAVEAFPEAEFESYTLPNAVGPGGYDFAGWVIHVNNPMDQSSGGDIFMEYNGDPPPEALTAEDNFAFTVYGTLTKEDIERVPPDDEGVRHVNVHAVWIKQDFDEPLLFLDNGAGEVKSYGMETPIASEGYIYLCNYPVTPPGSAMEFDGWYDAEGNRVDLLVSFFSFAPVLRNPDGSFAGYDWGSYEPVYLTAHWK